MSKFDKIVEKARRSPTTLRPPEVEYIYEKMGWNKRSRKGRKGSSHEIYEAPDDATHQKAVPKKRQVNEAYVKQMFANLGL